MGFLEALTLVFIILKLTNHIDWSWFWVLSPLIGSLIVYLAFARTIIGGFRTTGKSFGRRL